MNSRVWADLALVLDPGKMQDGLQHPGGLVWLKVRLWIRKRNWVWIKVESPLHRPAKSKAEANFAGMAEFLNRCSGWIPNSTDRLNSSWIMLVSYLITMTQCSIRNQNWGSCWSSNRPTRQTITLNLSWLVTAELSEIGSSPCLIKK